MKNKDLLALVEDKKVIKKGLSIVKRRIPLKHNFLKSLEAKMHVKRFNGLVFFYRYFETRFDLNRTVSTIEVKTAKGLCLWLELQPKSSVFAP